MDCLKDYSGDILLAGINEDESGNLNFCTHAFISLDKALKNDIILKSKMSERSI